MKKFARHRSLEELRPLLAERGIDVDTAGHDRGSDFIHLAGVLEGVQFKAAYSTFNGTFFGETIVGTRFTERSPLDSQFWFAALLDLLYVPQEATHG